MTPTISRFYGITIRMRFHDHTPAHFHAEHAGKEVVVAIETQKVLEGSLTPRAERLVIDWARIHREELMEDWSMCRRHESPLPIEPLE